MAKTAVRRKTPDQAISAPERDALNFDLERAPGFLFRQLHSRATALFSELSAQTEITPRQFGALLILYQSGPLLQTELGKRMRVDRSTLGEMLQRMFERGLVRRSSSPTDRRVTQLEIEAPGREVLLATVEAAQRAQTMMLAPLPPDQQPIFLRHLTILADAWQAAAKAKDE